MGVLTRFVIKILEFAKRWFFEENLILVQKRKNKRLGAEVSWRRRIYGSFFIDFSPKKIIKRKITEKMNNKRMNGFGASSGGKLFIIESLLLIG